MENLHYNLSEEEFSKSKKVMLWVFAFIFFLAGLGTIFITGYISLSTAPFGISIVAGIIAGMATFARKDHYFVIDNEKIEFKYGMFNPQKTTYLWNDIIEITFPHKQKKVKLKLKNNAPAVINLTWIQKKKSSHLRKHLFYAAKEKNINIIKVQVLS
jgi:hypothetical protein